jgi:RNA polymerase sigma factor FliA
MGARVESQVQGWWERYRDTGDPDVRERLILHYAPLVKYVAGRVAGGVPPNT